MAGAEQAQAEWTVFGVRPAMHAHPRRIVHACGGLISEDVAVLLGSDQRFSDRLSALLVDAYGLSPTGEGDPAVAPLALAPADRLEAIVRQAGAVYWARAIVGQIDSSTVTAIKLMLGEESYAAAIAHRDLAGADVELPPLDAFEAAVMDAGYRCLAAWCARQPPGTAQRMRLKFAEDNAFDEPVAPPFDEAGASIVERLTM